MHLTAPRHRAQHPACLQTTGNGLGGPVLVSGESRSVMPSGYFFAHGAPLNGRAGRGGRKACRLLTPVRQPRSVPLTLLGGLVCGSLIESEVSTMSNTPALSAPALTFHDTTFHTITRNGQVWLTAAEIAQALGYNRDTFIHRLYSRHTGEFTERMTGVVSLTTPGGTQETRIFSLRGAHLLGMFARTERAAEFRRWVLDILDRETGTPQTPTVDLWAEVAASNSTPEVRLPDAVQSAINRKAWALAHDAYELCREYLARRVAYRCEHGYPVRVIDKKQASAIIAETSLDMALAPRHFNQLEAIERMAEHLASVAADTREKLAAEINKTTGRGRLQ